MTRPCNYTFTYLINCIIVTAHACYSYIPYFNDTQILAIFRRHVAS